MKKKTGWGGEGKEKIGILRLKGGNSIKSYSAKSFQYIFAQFHNGNFSTTPILPPLPNPPPLQLLSPT